MIAKLREVFPWYRIPITRSKTISNQEIGRNKFGYADIIDDSKYKDYILQDSDILVQGFLSIEQEQAIFTCFLRIFLL